jgi:hypothetical protein
MMEVGVVLDQDCKPVFWHLPPNRTAGSIPDSRELWDVLWEGRKTFLGFAHSHPGSGVPRPSYEDVTTFAAIEAALGVRFNWWITSETHLALVRWEGLDRLHYEVTVLGDEPDWADELRLRSGQQMKMKESEANNGST